MCAKACSDLWRPAGPALLLVLGAACHAQSQPAAERPYVGVSQAVQRDNNILRQPDGPGRVGDTVLTTTLSGGATLHEGRQRLRAQAQVSRANHRRVNEQDHTGHRLAVGADWATAERLSGSINHSQARSLADPGADATTRQVLRNVQNLRETDAVARLGTTTPLTFELGAAHRQVDYSAPEFTPRELRQDQWRAGVRYRFSEALAAGLIWRDTRGRYPRFGEPAPGIYVADRFRRRELGVEAEWVPTGKSTVSARLNAGRETHAEAREFGFSGVTGQVNWDWKATGKLALNLGLSRDTGAELSFAPAAQGVATSTPGLDRITTGLALAARHDTTNKLRMEASYSAYRRELADAAGASGRDLTHRGSIGARYQASRYLGVGCSITRERREADTALSYDYSVSVAGCLAELRLD